MRLKICVSVLAALAFSASVFAQLPIQAEASGCFVLPSGPVGSQNHTASGTTCQSAFLVRYFANLTVGDSYIDATNDGSVITEAVIPSTATTINYSTANICMNVYTFDPAEELVSCCSCLITPNGLVSLSAQKDLISNTLTPASPTAIVVKLLSTNPLINGTNPLAATQSCNAGFPFGGPNVPDPDANLQLQSLAPALHAWGSTIHAAPGGSFNVAETPFSNAALSVAFTTGPKSGVTDELTRITNLCGFNQSNGSGFGQCSSCRAGGLGAAQQ